MLTYIQIERFVQNSAAGDRLVDGNGLEMRRRANDIVWYARYRQNGVQHQIILRNYPDLTLAEARRKIKVLKQKTEPVSYTVKKAVYEWLLKKQNEISRRTLHKMEIQLNMHLVQPLGNRPLGAIAPMLLINLWDRLAEEGKTDTIKRLCTYMAQIQIWAQNTGRCQFEYNLTKLSSNWAAHRRRHFPTIPPQELPALFTAYYTYESARNISHDLLRITFYSLLRQQKDYLG